MCVLSRSPCDKTPYISFYLSLCTSTGATASLPSGGRGWRSASLLQTGCTHLQKTLEQMEETVLPSLSAIQITMRRCGHCRQILIYSGVLVTIGTSTVLFCFVNLFWATMMRPNCIIYLRRMHCVCWVVKCFCIYSCVSLQAIYYIKHILVQHATRTNIDALVAREV